eukprot:CAMPEP_0197585822 /NCGR_PEP_ID=MMETSP1326-20131121/8001_1 /TAXON_ID=1155430 /ORGANISM="Genus nov. species nov., Strain RCC2288" /LENGTH=268 /DNA_ID=CAMNT_0043150377 /DNA_START=69 /DNA_END=875 /DNA_ORIENTATION=-
MALAALSSAAAIGGQGRAQLSSRSAASSSAASSSRSGVKVNALFGRKKPAPPPPPPPPVKKGLFGFGKKAAVVKAAPPPPPKSRFGFGKKAPVVEEEEEEEERPSLFGWGQKPVRQEVPDFEYNSQETMTDAYARIAKQRAKTKKEFEMKEKGGVSLAMFKIMGAMDFQEDIEADRGLLKAASRMVKGDKMTSEQYGALKRKVGGTKGGFFGSNVFATGEYLEKGYVVKPEEEPTQPLGGGFLIGVLVAVLATTGYVVINAVGSAGAI